MIETINEPHYECHYDFENRMVRIRYKGELSPSITTAAYEWMGTLVHELPLDHIVYGGTFDFRDVTSFTLQNLSSAKNTGTSFRTQNAERIQNIPAALIVQTAYQEMMVRTSMKLAKQETNDNPRVIVVWSEEEAQAHFKRWHEKNDTPPETSSDS